MLISSKRALERALQLGHCRAMLLGKNFGDLQSGNLNVASYAVPLEMHHDPI
jgi:hypothetical protein